LPYLSGSCNPRGDTDRVTRWVCDKSAQNVPQPIRYLTKWIHIFSWRKVAPKYGLLL
jgi:hypothetical protein